ncbi:cytochrome d ubiquinol oxidase subunit II [Nocardiopsis composta]|uniref:Cytochrome bd-type quinol oxidase subunit 2 n=2 Tax=Nocardiopsis composta TaxID=157465 RepID=A0A7W8VGM2_9ACTN|nr:cytochrome d ubiquinol oxidase subunit II [Nocardiopsis composta]MBB5435114.1 cytochrome bd-type quinol oxidase subunit 2 [Nocardiopsis composta]
MDIVPVLFLTGLVVGYFVLAGCDIGLGMLMPYLARTPAERRRLVSAAAPYFLGTEVWLVGAVGVVAGLFPELKSALFGGLWPVFTVLLAAWLLRDAGLWFRARVDGGAWRRGCDALIVGGSWGLALSWGAVLAGLLAGGAAPTPFTVACAFAVAALFLLRGAAFGAERLVPVAAGEAASADDAGRLTRVLSRLALGAAAVAAVAAVLPGGAAMDRPLALAAAALVPAAALAATAGLSGPRLSRHTSAVAIGSAPLLVAAAQVLPLDGPPAGTLALAGIAIVPMVPVMAVGQVGLYRMLRRPAADTGFFASPPAPVLPPRRRAVPDPAIRG